LPTTLLLASDSGEHLCTAGLILKQGGLVAVPTETVYGLAADACNPEAVRKIFAAKGRPADHPLIVHLPDVSALADWAKDIPAEAYQLAEAFWPGPLTLLLKKADHVDPVLTGGLDSIGLRVPAHPVLLQLLNTEQMAVAAPSANPYKKLSPTSAAQVMATMAGKIDAVLDGGDCELGLESTIVSLLGAEIQILRAGPVGQAELEQLLGQRVACPAQHQVKVSGNVAAHYQPETTLLRVSRDELAQKLTNTTQKIAVLALSPLPLTVTPHWHCQMPNDARQYGKLLYKQLYAADQAGAELILVESPPGDSPWLAVHNRLMRAASA